jgi:hypothetical protein
LTSWTRTRRAFFVSPIHISGTIAIGAFRCVIVDTRFPSLHLDIYAACRHILLYPSPSIFTSTTKSSSSTTASMSTII